MIETVNDISYLSLSLSKLQDLPTQTGKLPSATFHEPSTPQTVSFVPVIMKPSSQTKNIVSEGLAVFSLSGLPLTSTTLTPSGMGSGQSISARDNSLLGVLRIIIAFKFKNYFSADGRTGDIFTVFSLNVFS